MIGHGDTSSSAWPMATSLSALNDKAIEAIQRS